MHYIFNRSKKGTIKSIRVHIEEGDEESIFINNKFVNELRKYNLFSENNDNTQIISIITNAILLKENNKKVVDGSGSKYKFGNDTDFIYKFVPQLAETLKNTCIELLVSFFDSAKVQDLNNFIYNPSLIEFT